MAPQFVGILKGLCTLHAMMPFEKFTTDSVTVDNSMNERSSVEFTVSWCGLLMIIIIINY